MPSGTETNDQALLGSDYTIHFKTDVEWIAAYSITSILSAIIIFCYLWIISGNFISMYRFYSFLPRPKKILIFLTISCLLFTFILCLLSGLELSNYLFINKTRLTCQADYIIFFIFFIGSRYAQYMFLILRTKIGFKTTIFGMSRTRFVILLGLSHFAIIYFIIVTMAIFENSTLERSYTDEDKTYYLCTLRSKGKDRLFAGVGICYTLFDGACLAILTLDFNRRIKQALCIAVTEEDIKELKRVYHRHMFVLFTTLFGSSFLLIGNFVYDDTDSFNFFELVPISSIFICIVFLLSFEYRSFKVSLLWPLYLFGCIKIPIRHDSFDETEGNRHDYYGRERRGTGLFTGAEINTNAAKRVNTFDNDDQDDDDTTTNIDEMPELPSETHTVDEIDPLI